jgi:dTDP-4-dehydrorhamnose reductase
MRVLVTGAGGQLGQRVVAALGRLRAPIEVFRAPREVLDVVDRTAVHEAVRTLRPDWIINTAAMTGVDRAETEVELAWRVNALAVRWLVEAAEACGARVAHVSTDYVFDGAGHAPYGEWDPCCPLGVYGKSKRGGELELRPGRDLLARTAWLMSPSGRNVATTIARRVSEGAPLRFVADQVGSPTSAADLAQLLVELVGTGATGVFHLVNQGEASWLEVAQHLVATLGGDPGRVEAATTEELRELYPAPRPRYSVLGMRAYVAVSGREPRPWQEAVGEIGEELRERGV